MDAQTHWENIYGEKAADAVSWYRPHLEKSLELIEHAAHGPSASIIDVGATVSSGSRSLILKGLITGGTGRTVILWAGITTWKTK